MRLLLVTAVSQETDAIPTMRGVTVVTGGIGRTNAAAAVTEAIIRNGPYDGVLSTGVAGALPGSDLAVGDSVVASACVYAEEGLATKDGFVGMKEMGFTLGDFDGNAVPVDPALLERLAPGFRIGPVATVATCSGTDEAAEAVARRTGGLAEAMEGAAVVHAARRLATPAIELRIVSNRTGERSEQGWDLPKALAGLARDIPRAVEMITAH